MEKGFVTRKKERERQEEKECNEMRNETVRQRKLGRKKNKYLRKKEEKEGIVWESRRKRKVVEKKEQNAKREGEGKKCWERRWERGREIWCVEHVSNCFTLDWHKVGEGDPSSFASFWIFREIKSRLNEEWNDAKNLFFFLSCSPTVVAQKIFILPFIFHHFCVSDAHSISVARLRVHKKLCENFGSPMQNRLLVKFDWILFSEMKMEWD